MSPSAPNDRYAAAFALAVSSVISARPDRTGTRLPTASLARRITVSRSEADRDAFSPSIGSTMTPETPLRTSRSRLDCMALASIFPSGVIFVVTAGNTPFQLDMIVSPHYFPDNRGHDSADELTLTLRSIVT